MLYIAPYGPSTRHTLIPYPGTFSTLNGIIKQSFSELSEINGVGGSAVTPSSRSTKSTPRAGGSARNSGRFSNVTVTTSSSPAAHDSDGKTGNASTVGAKGKWESTGKRRSSGGGTEGTGNKVVKGPRQAVGQGSAFVRDFIRGAGIHRLDPRRLWGENVFSVYVCVCVRRVEIVSVVMPPSSKQRQSISYNLYRS